MKTLALVLTLFSTAVSLIAGPRAADNDTLALDQAVAIALTHNPAIRSGEAGVSSANAGRRQAESAYYPVITGQAGATHTEGAFVFNPSFPPRDQIYNNYAAGFQAQMTVFDFGRTISRVAASGSLLDAAEQDFSSTKSNTILSVYLAYFGLLQAQQLADVAVESHLQAGRRLTQAKAFYAVGKRPQFDVVRAEVDVANQYVNVIRTRNQREVARLQLDNVLGVRHAGEYVLRDSYSRESWAGPLDSTLALAMERRPDYHAARAREAASRAQATATWCQHLPTLSASGSYTWSAFQFPLFGRWNAGLTMSLPIFQGFSVDAQVQQADANVSIASAAVDALRESIRLEVEQSYLGLREAEEGIGATAKLVEQAELSLTLADRQYAAGVGTALEVSDAQLTLSNARAVHIQALFARSAAHVRLLRAVGVLVDRHP